MCGVNEDFDGTTKIMEQEAVTGIDDMSVFPLVNTSRKGEVFPIMLQQFRRAIGVVIVKRNTNHKLGRLHSLGGTTEEAAHTYKSNHSDSCCKPSQRAGSGWYSAHTPEGYAIFQQF